MLVAPDEKVNDVEVAPPELSEKLQEPPWALTVNDMSKPELAVSTCRVNFDADHTPATSVPPIGPSVNLGCALWTANAVEVTVTPVSPLPVAVIVTEPLEVVHFA